MENELQKSTEHNSSKYFKKKFIIKKYNDESDLIKVRESFSNPN